MPSAPRVFEWQGDVNVGLGRYARAAESFEQSLALDDRQAGSATTSSPSPAIARAAPARPSIRCAGPSPWRPGSPRRTTCSGSACAMPVGSTRRCPRSAPRPRLSPGLLEVREARVDVLQARGDSAGAVDELAALAALEARAARARRRRRRRLRPGRAPRRRRAVAGPRRRALPAVERRLRGARRACGCGPPKAGDPVALDKAHGRA